MKIFANHTRIQPLGNLILVHYYMKIFSTKNKSAQKIAYEDFVRYSYALQNSLIISIEDCKMQLASGLASGFLAVKKQATF